MSTEAQKYAIVASMRLSSALDSREVVERLSDLIPVILVDTREVSSGLSYEATRMLQPDRIYKTVFVIGRARNAAVLDEALATTESKLRDRCDAMAEECLPLLKRMLSARSALPRPDCGTVAILDAYRTIAQRFVEL